MISNLKEFEHSPIFIVGVPRSGTTLLQMILNSHSKIAIYSEIHFFTQIVQLKNIIPHLKSKSEIDEFFEQIKRINHYKYLPGIDELEKTVKSRMYLTSESSYENFYLYLMQEFAKSEKKERFGEKTPQNINYLEELIKLFPNAKIINIIIDPRAVVNSLVKVDWSSDDIIVNTLKWKIQIINSEQKKMNCNGNYLEVTYESLVENAETTLKTICEFIDVRYDSEMLNYFYHSDNYLSKEKDKIGVTKNIYQSSTNKWNYELSKSQIYIIQLLLGSYLTKFGYDKLNISLKNKVFSPITLIKEISQYFSYLLKERKRRRNEKSDIIYGDNTKFKEMLLKAIFTR